MNSLENKETFLNQLIAIEEKIDDLCAKNKDLSIENQLLKQRQELLTVAKAKLIQKNNFSISKVESMIDRIKSMEA
jgi:uncharacterized protein (TIGR02449 family)